MSRPMFPHAVDSTIMAAFRSCPQKLLRTYIEHWKPMNESVHLVAGGAFAKGLEVARKAYFEGEFRIPKISEVFNEETKVMDRKVEWEVTMMQPGLKAAAEAAGLQALLITYGDFECPSDSAKSIERTAGALEFYYSSYPFDEDTKTPLKLANGRSGIEFSFATPLDVRHPVTGDPILYTGRADMLCDFAGGIYVLDDKTTTSLGASWGRQWEMRGQFTGYIWSAQQAGIDAAGAIVRGVSILKTKYDTQEVLTNRAPFELKRWLYQTERDLERMIQCWESGWWDYALDAACAEYGGCSMVSICKSENPDSWLPMRFEKRVWDPLARRELSVEEWEKSWGHLSEA